MAGRFLRHWSVLRILAFHVSGDAGVFVCSRPLLWLCLSSSVSSRFLDLPFSPSRISFALLQFLVSRSCCYLGVAGFNVLRSSCSGFFYFPEDFDNLGGRWEGSPCVVSIPSTAAFRSCRAPAPHLQRLSCCLRLQGGLGVCSFHDGPQSPLLPPSYLEPQAWSPVGRRHSPRGGPGFLCCAQAGLRGPRAGPRACPRSAASWEWLPHRRACLPCPAPCA